MLLSTVRTEQEYNLIVKKNLSLLFLKLLLLYTLAKLNFYPHSLILSYRIVTYSFKSLKSPASVSSSFTQNLPFKEGDLTTFTGFFILS